MHNNRVTERKLLKRKFMDFEKDMESFEQIITSKQQLSTIEVEMKEKLDDLKVHVHNYHDKYTYLF